MPVTSTRTTSVPGLGLPSTPDLIAYKLHTDFRFGPGGITGSAYVQIQPYRANADGTSPLPIGSPGPLITIPSLFAKAVADAQAGDMQLANILASIEAYVQSLVTAKGV